MSRPEIVIVVAVSQNGVIGRDGRLPWHLPADLRHFKTMTMGAPMIMGRRTFESLPGLLPGRKHIILTRNRGFAAEGATVVHGAEEALAAVDGNRVSIIGGREVFEIFRDRADRMELTQILRDYEGDVRYRPTEGKRWIETRRESHPASDESPAYAFISLVSDIGGQ